MANNRLKGKFDLKVIVYFLSFAEQALAYYSGFCLVRVYPMNCLHMLLSFNKLKDFRNAIKTK